MFLDKYNDKTNWNGLNLTDNRRSNQRIIDCFSILRKASDPKINAVNLADSNIPITVYKYNKSNTSSIVEHFESLCLKYYLLNNQIVVRGNSLKNQLLGREAEQEPWKINLPTKLIEAKNKLDGGEIKEAVNETREIIVDLLFPDAQYDEKRDMLNDLKYNFQFNAHALSILKGLPLFELSIFDWTTKAQQYLKETLNLATDVNFDIKNRSSKYFNKEILKDPLKTHFKKSFTKSNIPITTIHQIKGKSLDGILIFFNEKSHKENITFSDITSANNTFPSEKQRLIYVALSRPKNLLAIAFPDSITDQQLKSKFGNMIEIVPDASSALNV